MNTTGQQRGESTLRADRIRAVAARAAELPWEMQRAADRGDLDDWRVDDALGNDVPPIKVVNMDVIYQNPCNPCSARCEAAGCVAGLTLTMFREEANRVWTDETTSPSLEAARLVLGLDRATAAAVFEGNGSYKRLHELKREEVLHALERAATGAVGADVWR